MPAAFVVLVSWLVPGAGHLLLGRRQKGLIFLVAVPLMFAIGLRLQGRLLPFDASSPLVLGCALASLANGIPYFIATAMDLGKGVVTAVTYDAGNAYIWAAGLLNALIMLDAFDVKRGAQMTSHFGLMLLFSFFVSLVFAVIAKDEPVEQLRLGAKFFGGFAAAGVVLGWLMYVLPF